MKTIFLIPILIPVVTLLCAAAAPTPSLQSEPEAAPQKASGPAFSLALEDWFQGRRLEDLQPLPDWAMKSKSTELFQEVAGYWMAKEARLALGMRYLAEVRAMQEQRGVLSRDLNKRIRQKSKELAGLEAGSNLARSLGREIAQGQRRLQSLEAIHYLALETFPAHAGRLVVDLSATVDIMALARVGQHAPMPTQGDGQERPSELKALRACLKEIRPELERPASKLAELKWRRAMLAALEKAVQYGEHGDWVLADKQVSEIQQLLREAVADLTIRTIQAGKPCAPPDAHGQDSVTPATDGTTLASGPDQPEASTATSPPVQPLARLAEAEDPASLALQWGAQLLEQAGARPPLQAPTPEVLLKHLAQAEEAGDAEGFAQGLLVQDASQLLWATGLLLPQEKRRVMSELIASVRARLGDDASLALGLESQRQAQCLLANAYYDESVAPGFFTLEGAILFRVQRTQQGWRVIPGGRDELVNQPKLNIPFMLGEIAYFTAGQHYADAGGDLSNLQALEAAAAEQSAGVIARAQAAFGGGSSACPQCGQSGGFFGGRCALCALDLTGSTRR